MIFYNRFAGKGKSEPEGDRDCDNQRDLLPGNEKAPVYALP